MTRRVAWTAAVMAVISAAACVRDNDSDEAAEPVVTLRVETPEALDWGGTGILRLALANEGEAAVEGGIVEVHVPDWLEFGSVEPAGTEVRVLSGDAETRLSYILTDSIPPGDSRVVEQQLRVRPRPARPPGSDTVPTVQLPPTNQTVRARLLTPAGEPLGPEVQATLQFVGWSGQLPPDSVRDSTAVRTDSAQRVPARGDTTRRSVPDTTRPPPPDTTPPR